ncbi:glycoside hydrolase family 16 protein [Serpula lacrymans var. lacrymans S7.3]|uniref:Glycoside hydrolase family 16 protein n=2 Tax=Serpula lacrymans var. lacrymans TaxID=341189 RepID=F8PJB1_SERL3|nr:glycoside hydrolase family 16 protein [Serpula lacrymans var. lacrymans S7.9]EGO03736.1 glycoside hydrolase family 16 protein [Serpula lacrymans var. lacrymans S7.3]EGO29602.1 glycoside hydrolase family 16 protein [Serpula lacrymans var. lacrymans S7.9]
MHSSLALLVPLLAVLTSVSAQTCNQTSLCPSTAPCCSEYGFCGSGYYCLGGCNPLYSNSLDSCKPNPICESANYTLVDTSRILTNYTYFEGNASEYDWVVEEGTIMNTTSSGEAALALLLTENGGGTLMSSTRYVHYGKITTRLKTGRWAGVVTAAITMSSIKDEIDWEFPGNQTTTGQTNYFWQGVIPPQTAGVTETGLSDTYDNFHDYTVDWSPSSLTFLVDGNVTRTIMASDCVDNSTGVSQYPNTPSRIQLSIWPAGISSEPEGTVEWAGGMINWNDPDYVSAGHFYALFQSVSVECNDPVAPNASDTGYVYGPNATLDTPSITFSNTTTELNGGAMIGAGLGGVQGFLVAISIMFALAVHVF